MGSTHPGTRKMITPTKEAYVALLHRPDRVGAAACERALIVLFNNQTEDEKRAEDTKHYNMRGFMPMDAKRMTSFAKQVLWSHKPEGERLSEKQLLWLRRPNKKGTSRIGKYTRQLIEAAELKAKRKLAA